MKSIQEQIRFQASAQGGCIQWRERSYVVAEILERWYYRGKWWLEPTLRGELRNYYRVACYPVQGEGSPSRALLSPGRDRVHPMEVQMGPYSDGVRKKKDPPLRLEATHKSFVKPITPGPACRIFEIYQKGVANSPCQWILSRVMD